MLNSINLSEGLAPFVIYEKRRASGTDNIYGLIHAIKQKVQIGFTYRKYGDDEISERQVAPYVLKEFRYRWYLLARDNKDGIVKSFALDKLSNLTITSHRIAQEKTYDVYDGISEFYNGIEEYNYNWLMKPGASRAHVYYPILHDNVNGRFNINSLLFFANPSFMNQVFPGIILPPGAYMAKRNVSQDDIINNVLPLNLGSPLIVDHILKMIVSRIILKRYFRFTYALVQEGNLKEYEAATKIALERMGIYTIAHVHRSGITI